MIAKTSPLRVAILRNYDTPAQWGQDMVDSWFDIIHSNVPDAEILVFTPITGGDLPDASKFDLIVLTGGVFNLTLPVVEPWVERTLEFIRSTARDCPETKIVGVCWGHQVICRAFEGKIAFNPDGDRVGVRPLKFTKEGIECFGTAKGGNDSASFALPEFHKRQVAQPPPRFIALAQDNEILLHVEGNVLSFQGHVEMTEAVGKGILDADTGPYTGHLDDEKLGQLYASFKKSHDGPRLFRKVVDWIST